jgi:hypothetical protein
LRGGWVRLPGASAMVALARPFGSASESGPGLRPAASPLGSTPSHRPLASPSGLESEEAPRNQAQGSGLRPRPWARLPGHRSSASPSGFGIQAGAGLPGHRPSASPSGPVLAPSTDSQSRPRFRQLHGDVRPTGSCARRRPATNPDERQTRERIRGPRPWQRATGGRA